MRLRGLLVMLVLAAAAACSGADGTTPAATTASPPAAGATETPGDGGATGVLLVRVQEGEQCPQEPVTPDPRCSPVPLPATGVTVLAADGSPVARAESAAGGTLRFRLPAGTYTVRGDMLSEYALSPEQPGRVDAGSTVEVVLTYGNGTQ